MKKSDNTKKTGAKIVLGLDTFLFAVFGILYCLNPVKMASSVGIALSDTGSIIDVMGLYGGLELGLGLFIGYCLIKGEIKTGLLAGSFTLSGIALARVFGIVRMGLPAQSVLFLVSLDLFGAIMNVVFLRKENKAFA